SRSAKERSNVFGQRRRRFERRDQLRARESHARRVKGMPIEPLDLLAAVEHVADERMIDRLEVRADLVTQRLRRLHLDEREFRAALDHAKIRLCGTRPVAHDIAWMDAGENTLLILRMIRERMLD